MEPWRRARAMRRGMPGPNWYGASGEPLHSGSRSLANQVDPLEDFVKQQPFTAALLALVIGYLLGKVT